MHGKSNDISARCRNLEIGEVMHKLQHIIVHVLVLHTYVMMGERRCGEGRECKNAKKGQSNIVEGHFA